LGGCGAEDMMIRFEVKKKTGRKEMKEEIKKKKWIHFIVKLF
jgi:hypothetical protein